MRARRVGATQSNMSMPRSTPSNRSGMSPMPSRWRGFSGANSLLYHLRPPTQVSRIDRGCEVAVPFAEAVKSSGAQLIARGGIPGADLAEHAESLESANA